jgi:hypothetical protein
MTGVACIIALITSILWVFLIHAATHFIIPVALFALLASLGTIAIVLFVFGVSPRLPLTEF